MRKIYSCQKYVWFVHSLPVVQGVQENLRFFFTPLLRQHWAAISRFQKGQHSVENLRCKLIILNLLERN